MLALAQINFGDAFRVWRRNYDVYVRLWKTEMVAPLFEPVFSVIGFGWGVGSLVLLSLSCATTFLAGFMMFQLVRSMWMWGDRSEPGGLLKMVSGLF